MTDFASRLRAHIHDVHERIERLPFAVQMIEGCVDRDTYALVMAQVYLIQEALESELARHPEWCLTERANLARASLLANDLARFGRTMPERPWPMTEQFLTELRHWSSHVPWKLTGALYVLEGSRMGSLMLARSLARGFGLELREGVGIDYHWAGQQSRQSDWQKFKAILNGVAWSSTQHEDVCESARATIQALFDVYAAASKLEFGFGSADTMT